MMKEFKKPSKREVAMLLRQAMLTAETTGIKDWPIKEVVEKTCTAYAISTALLDVVDEFGLDKTKVKALYEEMFGKHLLGCNDVCGELIVDFKEHQKQELTKDKNPDSPADWFSRTS